MFDVNTELRIDGEPVGPDVIGAFTADGVCVGWTQAVANNGYVTVQQLEMMDQIILEIIFKVEIFQF